MRRWGEKIYREELGRNMGREIVLLERMDDYDSGLGSDK